MPVKKQESSFDFSRLIPESVKNFASTYTPEPIKKAAKFGFETLVPSDPNDQIGSFISPLPVATALNLPRGILKQASEELLDTLDKHIPYTKYKNVVKDVLNKHKSSLGYLGGEGNVVDRADSRADRFFQHSPESHAVYTPMFDNTPDAKEFMDYVKEDPVSSLDDWKYYSKVRRGKDPAIGLNELALNFGPHETKLALEEELTHMGQDVAPKGMIRQAGDIPSGDMIYETDPVEIAAQMSRRLNPNVTQGMKLPQRLEEALKSKGIHLDIPSGPYGPKSVRDYFTDEILPLLKRYGK